MKAKENRERKNSIKEEMQTKEKGITLIALIVTIIIMLILAGVTINIALGDNGLFSKSKEAVEMHKEAVAKEKISMSIGEYMLDINVGNMTEEEKENHLKELLSKLGPTRVASDANYYETEIDGYLFWTNKETLEIESKGEATEIKPETITVNKPEIEIKVGQTEIIEMSITPTGISGRYLKYTSSDEEVATVKNGTITGKGIGTAIITIESTEDSKIKAEITVTVNEAEVISISLSPTTLTINMGETLIEAIKVTYKPEEVEGKTVEWESDKTDIATVDNEGKVTGVAVGTATITATTPNGKTATCTVTVIDPEATKKRAGDITITPKYDYGKIVTGYNSKTRGITWRLWYVDNVSPSDKSQDTIYLIGDFITTAQAPTKTVNGTTYTVNGGDNDKCLYFTNILPAYTNSSRWVWNNRQAIASKWLSQWYAYGSHKTTGDNNSMKAVAYMMDSTIWTSSFGDTNNKANYVIGGPTIEMYCASYKDSHPKKYLESRVNGDTGYDIKWNTDDDSTYAYYQRGVDRNGNHQIYTPGKYDYPTGMWIAGQSSYNTDRVMFADFSGGVNDNVNNITYKCSWLGICPVVSLKSGVQLEASGDGFRIN